MNNVLLISEDTLKTYSNLNDSTFGKWILPAIREAQEMGLMPIIGECLYSKICELVADGSISDELFVAYKDLLDDKIQPYLIYKTLSNIIPILNGKMANMGTVLTGDEHIVNFSQGEADLLKTYYSERCDFYTKRLQDFIKNNASAFPEIACGCGNMQPNLDSSENSVGLWLGGSRGKVVSNGKCACSSTGITCGDYQSGFTDGVEFQKRKLEVTAVTTNGRYIREDGYSEITVNVSGQSATLTTTAVTANGEYAAPQGYDGFSSFEVNVPQTGYTQQDLDNAYKDGYNDGSNKNGYFTIEVISAGTLSISVSTISASSKTIEYKLNDGNWIDRTSHSVTDILVNNGDIVELRGNNLDLGNGDSDNMSFGRSTCKFNVRGNIMSLVDKNNFTQLTAITGTFRNLFADCTGLTDASRLILPATSLSHFCYTYMFNNCRNLTDAPELPAETLVPYCYEYMFNNCNSLTHIKCLATDISALYSTNNWVNGVAASGTFVKKEGVEWPIGISGIPENWVVQSM